MNALSKFNLCYTFNSSEFVNLYKLTLTHTQILIIDLIVYKKIKNKKRKKEKKYSLTTKTDLSWLIDQAEL